MYILKNSKNRALEWVCKPIIFKLKRAFSRLGTSCGIFANLRLTLAINSSLS